jgi:protein NrfC
MLTVRHIERFFFKLFLIVGDSDTQSDSSDALLSLKGGQTNMAEIKKDISRRDFILSSGAVVAGGVLGQVVATGFFPAAVIEAAPAENLANLPPAATSYLVVDSKKCSGCLTCMFTCSTAHEGTASLSTSRIQIVQNSLQPFPYDLTMYQCRQCTDPLCVTNCPTGACQIDTAHGNTRIIDPVKCIGCQTCLRMCPHPAHRAIWDAALKKATKCDLCANTPYFNKPDASKPQQACVLVCPMDAISVVKQIPDQTDDRGYNVNLRKA